MAEVNNVGHDRDQRSSMAQKAREATGRDKLTVLADRGYFKGEEILGCEQIGIVPLVPKPQTSNNKAAGLFDKADFRSGGTCDQHGGKTTVTSHASTGFAITTHCIRSRNCPGCLDGSGCWITPREECDRA